MYRAGWGRAEIDIAPRGYAMQGYGMWSHRARGRRTPLYARAIFIEDESRHAIALCCLDLGYVTHAMRVGVCDALQARLGADFNADGLVLTCTHTHSGPGGCSHDALYNVVTPGFVSAHLRAVIDACVEAILSARETAAPTELSTSAGAIDSDVPVAWNRSIDAYNRNSDVTPRSDLETHLALNRSMQMLVLRHDGNVRSFVSLFGVHATCIGNSLALHDADNKGYAATQAEAALDDAGAPDSVAVFAQATAGDVSPHYHGPGDVARRKAIFGDAEYAYAEQNGHCQSAHALALVADGAETSLTGDINSVFTYVDFTSIKADPQFAGGHDDAWTSEPCHGVAFFRGTRIDGPGMPPILGAIATRIATAVRNYRMKHLDRYPADRQAYFRRTYAAQGPKAIVLEAGTKRVLGVRIAKLPRFVDPSVAELARQARSGAIDKSALVPTVLPLQIVRIGQLAIVCCPGEFTTTAGRRVIESVESELRDRDVTNVWICTYCNDYMGYVTTNEEYQAQRYEGGHTVYGQWTLAAFQTKFAALAAQLYKPAAERSHDRTTRPAPAPADELALRTDLPVPN